MNLIKLASKETFKIIFNPKTGKEGFECFICNKKFFESNSVEKAYCPECNIHHKYANYLSFV